MTPWGDALAPGALYRGPAIMAVCRTRSSWVGVRTALRHAPSKPRYHWRSEVVAARLRDTPKGWFYLGSSS